MRILLATSNPHKRDEILAIFDQLSGNTAHDRLALVTLAELKGAASLEEPVEDGDTFEANALIKARYYAAATGELCLADDSGLEVDALGGAPGMYSARYSGETGERAEVDLANNRLVLEKLADTPAEKRTARFVCAMTLVTPDQPDAPLGQVRGTVEGRIITPDEAADVAQPERGRGANGFGYDPLFWLADRGCTSAELLPDQKNAISHRGNAARKLWQKLRPMLDASTQGRQ